MDYTKYVNIKQGTYSEPRYSWGNTLPLVAAPFGMNHFSMQTKAESDGWFYHPEHRQLEGIRLTHQPSPWVRDYGHFVLMPQNGEAYILEEDRSSGFRELVLNPGYMELFLKRYYATVCIAATERCAVMKIRWDKVDIPRLAFLPFAFFSGVELDAGKRELTGYTMAHGDGTRRDFAIFFCMSFDKPINVEKTLITEYGGEKHQGMSGEGIGTGMNIAFDVTAGEELMVRIAASFVSVEQARRNLEKEIASKNYDIVKLETVVKWNDLLSRIELDASEEKKKTFYSCMYRCFLFPRIFYEINQQGEEVHYCTKKGTIEKGVCYTDNGFWDTYRTLYPLFTLIIPNRLKEILAGYLNFYRDEGWLPKWISPGERGIMPGTLIDAVFGDAATKGLLTEEQLLLALEGMLKHATVPSENPQNGRRGVTDYIAKGYIPSDKYEESVNHSLDAYYCDYCIARMADIAGKEEISKEYRKRSQNYRLLFDKESGFMRGRKENGNRAKEFSPISWGGDYCEGAAWQNSFAVFHDIDGLAELYGGKDKMIAKLDELFAMPPYYEVGAYQKEIHEMTEMADADFGQCAISNQPSFHLPYLFSALGNQAKTAYWVKRIQQEAFHSSEKGFPGDEDNGSMSAWYIFSTMGMYPLCPGKAEYVLGICTANMVTLHLENENSVQITNNIRTDRSESGIKVKVDGALWDTTVISHERLLTAEKILFYE